MCRARNSLPNKRQAGYALTLNHKSTSTNRASHRDRKAAGPDCDMDRMVWDRGCYWHIGCNNLDSLGREYASCREEYFDRHSDRTRVLDAALA